MTHRTYWDASAAVEKNEFVWIVVGKIIYLIIGEFFVFCVCGSTARDGGGTRMFLSACGAWRHDGARGDAFCLCDGEGLYGRRRDNDIWCGDWVWCGRQILLLGLWRRRLLFLNLFFRGRIDVEWLRGVVGRQTGNEQPHKPSEQRTPLGQDSPAIRRHLCQTPNPRPTNNPSRFTRCHVTGATGKYLVLALDCMGCHSQALGQYVLRRQQTWTLA